MATKYNITIDKGSTFQMTLIWKDSSDTVIDLTGYSARMMIKQTHNDAAPIISLTSGSGITITALSGRLDFLISATATKNIAQFEAVYDVEVESSGGIVTRLVEGKVNLSPEVTK
jgi:hypothetical protein